MLRRACCHQSYRFLLAAANRMSSSPLVTSDNCPGLTVTNFRHLHLSTFTPPSLRCHLMSTHAISKDDTDGDGNIRLGSEDSAKSATDILASLSAEEARKLKVLQVEADVWMSLGHRVPDKFTDEMWLSVLREYRTSSQRRKIYKFWFKNEKLRWKDEELKAKKAVVHAEKLAHKQKLRDEGKYVESNTILQYVRDVTMNKFYYNNIAYSAVHGNTLVIDMGFEEYMDKKEMMNLVKQIVISHGFNKVAQEPFHFHLCNLKPGSKIQNVLHKKGPGWENIPYTNSAEHYLDLYPKDKLVYLTPNSRNTLERFDPNSVYIVGGIVDLHGDDRLTFAQARKENLRTAKLPLDKYLQWKQGTKSLTLDQMTQILLTLKDTNDWHQALRHIPTRKLRR